jgi:hypothetical protein
MRYFDYPQAEVQRKPLVPNKLISGMLPGATEIRIGGNENIKISGKDQVVSISDGSTNVSLCRTSATSLGLSFTDGSGIKRLHAGVYPDDSVKIKLSQLTKDVLTATDDDLIWSSDFNSFKITETDTVEIPSASFTAGTEGGVGATVNLTKTYTTRPSVVAFFDSGSSNGSLWSTGFIPLDFSFGPPGTPISINTAERRQITVTTTTINFTTIFTNSSATTQDSPAYTLRYYVLKETSAST